MAPGGHRRHRADPDVVAGLLGRVQTGDRRAALSTRTQEREVLALIARGRSNSAVVVSRRCR